MCSSNHGIPLYHPCMTRRVHDVAGVVARRRPVSSCLGQHMVEYTAHFRSIGRTRTRILVRFVGTGIPGSTSTDTRDWLEAWFYSLSKCATASSASL
ncbi:Hypothetical protein RY67_2111 [Bifidobacterium longum subsp. infantis]|uniref:Uncharacterized protein n=1 Tax=Bifidobacterium longum subsp. infantis TaxID=1682 RepID=A0A0M4LIH1_BIFLI|nr:Hypothetical protein RY67_2111 [Bifidobacterium longum subsp. infantis]